MLNLNLRKTLIYAINLKFLSLGIIFMEHYSSLEEERKEIGRSYLKIKSLPNLGGG